MPFNAFDDVQNAFVNKVSIVPQVATATVTGTAVDVGAGDNPITLVFSVGAINDATTIAVTVTESATSGGTFTAISGATASIAGTDDSTVQVVTFRRTQPYLKAVATLAGATQSAAIAATFHSFKKVF